MNASTLIKMTSVLTLALVASYSVSAENNGPKPRCPIGKIAVLEQGHWQCQELTIKSHVKAETRAIKSTRAVMPSKIQKKQAAQPDFTIVAVKKMRSPRTFRVTVKNKGAAYGAKQTNVWATHHRADGTTNSVVEKMPQVFGAGEQKYIDIKFTAANIERGDKLTFTVDSFKVIAEKNERNNNFKMTF